MEINANFIYFLLLLCVITFTLLYFETGKFRHKMTTSSFYYIAIAFVCFLILYMTMFSDESQLKCIIAGKNGNRYCIRDRDPKKLQKAANTLASVVEKCKTLANYMNLTHPNDDRIKRLMIGFNPQKISETLPTSELTAFTENKGQKMAFCLNRKKEDDNQIIDQDTLFFVAMHEMSHIMNEGIGHKSDFWETFKFLLENAKKSGIYKPVDYKKNPAEYCGQTINDNPLYDYT